MRPRNNTERRVVELSATLPPLRPYDAERITRNYNRIYKKGFAYYLVFERCKEFQVIRYYYKSRKSCFEFAQIWFNKNAKIGMAKSRALGVDSWIRDSEITIKDWFKYGHEYTYLGGFERLGWSGYVIRSLLPELRQRGLRTSSHGINPFNLCQHLLHSNRVETLFKLRQYLLVHYFCSKNSKINDCVWQAIRVALRHGYHWDTYKEVSDWVDMVNDLNYLDLDTHNPHYICPANLAEAHQHYNEKRRVRQEQEQLKMETETIKAYEPTFHKNRERFLDMVLHKGRVTIQIIPTAMAIKEEGIAMHHCVGGYYNRPESLILSAKVDGKRMETIEVSLTDYKIVQSRGLQNKHTSFHNQIVYLMKQGLPEIKKRNQMKIAV